MQAVRDLPEDASFDDAIERLIFLRKVEEGLEQAKAGQTVPLDKVESDLQRRREERQSS